MVWTLKRFCSREPAGIDGEIQIRYPGFANRKKEQGSTKIAVQRTERETGHVALEKGEVKRKGPRQTPKHQVERCFSPKARLGEGLKILGCCDKQTRSATGDAMTWRVALQVSLA